VYVDYVDPFENYEPSGYVEEVEGYDFDEPSDQVEPTDYVEYFNGVGYLNYTGQCHDIYTYMVNQKKTNNFIECKMNDEGEVTELSIHIYCLKDEQLTTILSYNTIENLDFSYFYGDLNESGVINNKDLKIMFGCTALPKNYEILSTLTNLKSLSLNGVPKVDSNIIAVIPKTIETLWLNEVNLTQEAVDYLGEFTNLKSLTLYSTELREELDFKKFEYLKNLTFLNLSECRFTHLELLKYCQSLKKLIIGYTSLDKNSLDDISYVTGLEDLELNGISIVDSFSSLKELKSLTSLSINCYTNSITDLSPNFFSLTNLKNFYSSLCNLNLSTSEDDSLTWANLKNLEYFSVNYNYPGRIDLKNFGNNPNLKEFKIYCSYVSSIPESIGNLKNIEILNLSNNKITSIPESIGNLETLRILNLNDNELTSLPDKIGNLKNLEELNISNNEITSLPESFENLVQLKRLDGYRNKITNIPTNIGNLSELEYINLSYNKITKIPKSIGNNLKLTEINLSENLIEVLPDEMGNLKNLVLLELRDNNVVGIPSTFENLESIEFIFLNRNGISEDSVPEFLYHLPNFRRIML